MARTTRKSTYIPAGQVIVKGEPNRGVRRTGRPAPRRTGTRAAVVARATREG